MKNITEIIQSVSPEESRVVLDALKFAEKAHAGQKRKTGDPYIIHPIAVAEKSWDYYKDIDLLIACLLHDTVEDSDDVNILDIYNQFGSSVGWLVDTVTKTQFSFLRYEKFIPKSTIEKLLCGGLQDVRALLVKILDRDHNLQTLDIFRPQKQMRVSFETQAIYKPLEFLFVKDSIENIKEKFHSFLKENFILDVASFKECLYSMSFSGNGEEDFPVLYRNSDKVIWRIEDKNLYLSLCRNNKAFEQNHDLVRMQEDTDEIFFAEIQFTKAFGWDNGKLSVSRCKGF